MGRLEVLPEPADPLAEPVQQIDGSEKDEDPESPRARFRWRRIFVWEKRRVVQRATDSRRVRSRVAASSE